MADISRIVSVVEILNVRLSTASFGCGVRPSQLPETLEVTASPPVAVLPDPADDVSRQIEVTFALEVRGDGDTEASQVEVRATFELSYRIPENQSVSGEEWQAFADVNAVFNAWPYWRELVHTSFARMGLPPLTVPVFRVRRTDDSGDSEEV